MRRGDVWRHLRRDSALHALTERLQGIPKRAAQSALQNAKVMAQIGLPPRLSDLPPMIDEVTADLVGETLGPEADLHAFARW